MYWSGSKQHIIIWKCNELTLQSHTMIHICVISLTFFMMGQSPRCQNSLIIGLGVWSQFYRTICQSVIEQDNETWFRCWKNVLLLWKKAVCQMNVQHLKFGLHLGKAFSTFLADRSWEIRYNSRIINFLQQVTTLSRETWAFCHLGKLYRRQICYIICKELIPNNSLELPKVGYCS